MMDIEFKPVRADTDNYDSFMEVYLGSFPPAEIIPFEKLMNVVEKRGFMLETVHSEGKTIGMHFTGMYKNAVYVAFLAISEHFRSKGYGSAIMNHIKSIAPGSGIFLNVEPADASCDNLEQRISRIEFYRKNGLELTDYNITIYGETFSVMSTDPKFINDYIELISLIGLGPVTKNE